MQFVLPLLPLETGATRRMTTLHLMLALVLCGIGAGSFVLYWFTTISPNFKHAYKPFIWLGILSFLLGLGIFAAAIFYKNWLREGKRSLSLRILEVIAVLGASGTFAFAGQAKPAVLFGIIALAIFVAALWELRKPAAPQALINEQGIRLPKGGIIRLLPWTEIDRVLVRHGILSIELEGNRLLQRNLLPGVSNDAKSIEDFCKEKSAEALQKRVPDW
ncbi:MAG: hypothetical protein JST06_03100 [Bacteroidetes bacterium]|nr:hypothetical protein [Bacteroidota bacterium]MBS1628811.1 hypothetical protein [Bacteroidota bacterium]